MSQKQIRLVSLVLSVVLGTAALAGIGAGQKIGIDLGPTATDNWNNVTDNGTIAAGSVVAIDGATLPGVSITVADGRFFNNDGADDWVGLTANGGSSPEEFVDSVTTDIAGTYGTDVPFQIAIAGLNDNLTYDIVAVCTSVPPYANEETVTINDAVNLTVARDDARDNGTFHSFTEVTTDGAGNLVLIFTNDPQQNPIVCGVLITAVAMGQASGPQPETEAQDVLRDATLSWGPGLYAAVHDVYLGTSFDDVNEASRTNPMGVLLSEGQTQTTYAAPVVFEYGQTYYWRIDEVNAAPDNTIFKGETWSFTVEPLAYPLANVTATSNVASEPGAGPENTVNGSGLNANDEHSVVAGDMWQATPAVGEALYIQYEFEGVYKLHEMLVWNYNVQFEPMLGFGLKDVTVEYSEDGEAWAVLGDVVFNQAVANETYTANTTVDLGGVAAQFVRLNVNSGYGPLGQFGLSEVRFTFIPVQPREPQPEEGAADVAPDADLSWRAGREAVSHEVYLSTDPDALELIDTTSAAAVEPGALELGATYYWKVDEVNEAEAVSMWEGPIWSFSTQEYLVVEDFEGYDDEDNLIYETWIDGWVNETGSTVGYLEAPFAETTIVKSGNQSMPLFYDNVGTSTSEADFSFTAQDWTSNGIEALSLYFHGAAENDGQLYVKINDTKVAYDGDGADIARAMWQPWNIDLMAVGVSLTNVTKLTIGIEGAGAKGVVYIDDIRLYPDSVEYVTPTEPDAAGLLAHYALEGNASDASGNGYDGVENGEPTYGAGVEGQAIKLDGIDDFVDLGVPENWPSGAAPRTLCAWAQTYSVAPGWRVIAGYGSPAGGQATGLVMNGTALHASGYGSDVSIDNFWAVQEWHHVGLTYDGATVCLYADGAEVASGQREWNTAITVARIGRQVNDAPEFWDGMVDEVRFYDRVLPAEEIAWLAGRRVVMHKPF